MKSKLRFILTLFLALLLFALPLLSQETNDSKDAIRQKVIRQGNEAVQLYNDGKYKEGIVIARQVYQMAQENFGLRDSDTLTSMNNLAALLKNQGHFEEAEPLYIQGLQLSQEILGEKHPQTLTSLNNLAGLYKSQGRYGEAEPLYIQGLQLRQEVLGEKHPQTLSSLNNQAGLYEFQGRYGEAEPLYIQGLQLSQEALGKKHPDTLTSLNNLATLYYAQGQHDKAEPLFLKSLQYRREELGKNHPTTLASESNFLGFLIQMKQEKKAFSHMKRMETQLFSFAKTQLDTTLKARVRKLFLHSISTFQDMALNWALQSGKPEVQAFAAGVLLRWMQLDGEEQQFLANLTQVSADPKIVALSRELQELRASLANASSLKTPSKTSSSDLQNELEQKELQLRQISRQYNTYLQSQRVNLEQIRLELPNKSGMLILKEYDEIDFGKGYTGKRRFMAALIEEERVKLYDLGETGEVKAYANLLGSSLEDILKSTPEESREQIGLYKLIIDSTPFFYDQYFSSLDQDLKDLDTLFIVPDGSLNQVPFASLKINDEQRWIERQQIRRLQTGRDLLRIAEPSSNKGLLAMGGIDYGVHAKSAKTQQKLTPNDLGLEVDRSLMLEQNRNLGQQVGVFETLKATPKEVAELKLYYKNTRIDEPLDVRFGTDATEAYLKGLTKPPRVLHLATHGFYLEDREGNTERPLLLSGLALSGANEGLQGNLSPSGEDGILYSLEVLGLHLKGTELVTLSACETGQGAVDYSEGVFGLVRAFRIAGAKNVLMTLRSVPDEQAKDFMVAFYRNWLGDPKLKRTPAEALRQTRLDYINHENEALRNPEVWSPYVLVE